MNPLRPLTAPVADGAISANAGPTPVPGPISFP